MKPQKFRVWDKQEHRWALSADREVHWENFFLGEDGELYWMEFSEEGNGLEEDTVGRYEVNYALDVLDNKGKEVYENDLTKAKGEHVIYQIVFGSYQANTGMCEHNSRHDLTYTFNGWHIKPVNSHLLDGETDGSLSKEDGKYFEVVGNIYENPELLEDK